MKETFNYKISEIECPWCGYKNDLTGGVCGITTSKPVKAKCKDCGKEFTLSVEFEFYASTEAAGIE